MNESRSTIDQIEIQVMASRASVSSGWVVAPLSTKMAMTIWVMSGIMMAAETISAAPRVRRATTLANSPRPAIRKMNPLKVT